MKTKALISCVVTAQLICGFVFACAKSGFSHDVAHTIKVAKNEGNDQSALKHSSSAPLVFSHAKCRFSHYADN